MENTKNSIKHCINWNISEILVTIILRRNKVLRIAIKNLINYYITETVKPFRQKLLLSIRGEKSDDT